MSLFDKHAPRLANTSAQLLVSCHTCSTWASHSRLKSHLQSKTKLVTSTRKSTSVDIHLTAKRELVWRRTRQWPLSHAKFKAAQIPHSSATVLLVQPKFKENPHNQVLAWVLAKPPALVGLGIPLKLPSVLMVTKGKGTRHHRSNTIDFLREDGVEMELRKKNSVVCDTALCYKTWLGTEWFEKMREFLSNQIAQSTNANITPHGT